MNRKLRVCLAAALAPWLAVPAAAQVPVGPDQQINESTTSTQNTARVAGTPDGGFVVAWFDLAGPCESGPGASKAQARRFLAEGEPAGSQFPVGNLCDAARSQYPSAVLVDEDGEFTIVWEEPNGPAGDGGSARRFAADGLPLGGQFVVAPDIQSSWRLTADGAPTGEFVVARGIWSYTPDPWYVSVRGFDAAGAPQGSFPIEAAPGRIASTPDVDVATTGEFVVTWMDSCACYSPDYIRMQRFDADGTPLGETIDVAGPGSAASSRTMPTVARNGAGDFLVVWEKLLGTSLQARALSATGIPLGPEVQVDDWTTGSASASSVTAAPDGSFIVAWTDSPAGDPGGGDGSSAGIRARRLSATGELLAPSFAVNSYTTGAQSVPSVAFLADGDFVVAWSSAGSFGDDDSGSSIQLRRFRLAFFADGFETGDLSRWVFGED